MLFAIIVISYILAINVFGFRIVRIQRADRLKNGDPTPTPQKQIAERTRGSGENLKTAETTEKTTHKKTADTKTADTKTSDVKTYSKNDSQFAKSESVATKRKTSKTNPPPHPQNGEAMKKDDLLFEEKLNLKRYERIPDVKILMVALFGGALGEFVSFLIYKYRTTNTLLMVALPVLISLWVYLFYILVAGFFIV